MKLSNERMMSDIQRLGEVAKKTLPVKASYAIAKNIAKIEAELKVYGNEREKLIEKYAEKNEKGNIAADENGQIKFKPECAESWNKEIKELLAIENEVNIHKFKLDALEGYSMTPVEMMLIDYMIEE